MFCTQCGHDMADGDRFCGRCGTPRGGPASGADTGATDPRKTAEKTDWQQSYRYSDIIVAPQVVEVFDIAEKRGRQGIGFDDYLSLVTPVLPKASTSYFKIMSKLAYKLADNEALAHENRIARQYGDPPGLVIGALVCALAAKRYNVQDVIQKEAHCTIKAIVPAGLTTSQFMAQAEISAQGDKVELALGIRAILGGLAKRRTTKVAHALFEDVDGFLTEVRAA